MTLNLDPRQRAMLLEMGIRTWVAPSSKSKTAQFTENKTDVSVKRSSVAIKSGVFDTPQGSPSSSNLSASPLARSAPAPSAGLSAAARAALAASANPAPNASAARAVFSPNAEHVASIATLNWTQLQQKALSCQACALCTSRKNVVFGAGPALPPPAQAEAQIATSAPNIDILIVGDPPSDDEDSSGMAASGEAGKLLANMLRALRSGGVASGAPMSLQSNVYLASAIQCRPPASRNASTEEFAQCAPYLQRQIALLQPQLIIALGRFAVSAVLGSSEPLGRLRGRAHHISQGERTIPVVVSYHPSVLLRTPSEKSKSWDDWLLAMQVLREQAVT